MKEIIELAGNYPLLESRVAERSVIKERLFKERKVLDKAWADINQSSKVIDEKLKSHKGTYRNYHDAGEIVKTELKYLYDLEYSDIWKKITSESLILVNKDGLDRIVELLQSEKLSSILLMKKIRYGQLEESWSLGWDSDHGIDINTYNEFAYSLDLVLEKRQIRVGVQGEVRAIYSQPKLRVNYINFYLLESQPKNQNLTEHLKRESQGIERIQAYNCYERGKGIIALQTNNHADSFFKGHSFDLKRARLNSPYKTSFKTLPVNTQYASLLSPIAKIIRFMNHQIGKIPCYLTKDSFVSYDKEGEPALNHRGARK